MSGFEVKKKIELKLSYIEGYYKQVFLKSRVEPPSFVLISASVYLSLGLIRPDS